MEEKRLRFNLNDFPKWPEINWIKFEIDNTVDALKKSIEINQNAFDAICNNLEQKIVKVKAENKEMDPQDLHQYIEHLHGLEERIVIELNGVQNSSVVIYGFAILENKLKMITEKLIADFEFDFPDKKGDLYVSDYWKILSGFLGEKISLIEKYYTPLKNQMVLRNVIIHQNNVAADDKYKLLKHLKTLKFNEFEGAYYLVNIENEYLGQLVNILSVFFKELIALIIVATNEKL